MVWQARRTKQKMEIRVTDLDSNISNIKSKIISKYYNNDTKKTIASRNKVLSEQKPNTVRINENRTRNENLVLRNFIKEFHETMLETVGYSSVKNLICSDNDEELSSYDLTNVQIEVNIIEVLWRLSFFEA